MVFILILSLLPIVLCYGVPYPSEGQYLQPPPSFGYAYEPFSYEDSVEYKPKRGRRGPPGPPGSPVPPCEPKCPDNSFAVDRIIDGNLSKWCIEMLYNPMGYDIGVYMNQTCMIYGGGVLTAFKSKQEMVNAYFALRDNYANLNGRDDSYAFIGVKARYECKSGDCPFNSRYYLTDGVTTSTTLFDTESDFIDKNLNNGMKMCVAARTSDGKMSTYDCNANNINKPAKLFFCGRRPRC